MGIDDTSNIVLGSLRYKSSQDKGVFLNVPLEQTSKEIIEFDRNVDLNLEEVNGIEKATTDYAKQICKIKFDEEKISVDQIIVVIKENGYEV